MENETVTGAHLLSSMHAGIKPYVLPRLFLSPTELKGLFEHYPAGSDDAVLVFTKSKADDVTESEINPRQSFIWKAGTKTIVPFNTLASLYETLKIAKGVGDPIRHTGFLCQAAARPDSAFKLLHDTSGRRSVFILLAQPAARQDIRLFFDLLLPYLELYRMSTLHAVNDAYKTRDDELLAFEKEMNPSAAETAKALLDVVAGHHRFNISQFALLKYQAHDHSWNTVHASGLGAAATALRALGASDEGHLSRAAHRESIDVLKSRKMLGIVDGHDRVVLIPFVRVHPQLILGDADNAGKVEDESRQQVKKKATPDLVIALIYPGSPPQGIIHSLLYFRNYYFDVYFPALIAHTKAEIANKTRDLRASLHLSSRENTASSPWGPFREVCSGALTVLCKAYDLEVSVTVYDIAEHALRPVFVWPDSAVDVSQDSSKWDSLHKGRRGLAASVLYDGGRDDAGKLRDTLYLPDVSRVRNHEASETGSRFFIRLRYRAASVGVVTFRSREINAFDVQLRSLLASFIYSLEDYLREFLATHDAHWLSITAGAYHNLHELRQAAKLWDDQPKKCAVLQAVQAFDQTFEGQPGTIHELQTHFDAYLREQEEEFLAPFHDDFVTSGRTRCRFQIDGLPELATIQVPRITIELIKRLFTNLIGDFPITGEPTALESFTIWAQAKPVAAIHFRQERNTCFPQEWFGQLSFRPMHNDSAADRLHHGLYLCSAIARYLGGFAWMGNMDDTKLGRRSVVEIMIPLAGPA